MPKSWVALTVEVRPSLSEAVSNFLIEQGSPGVAQGELKESLGRKRERITGYFLDDRRFSTRKREIRAYLLAIHRNDRRSFNLRSQTIKPEKWAEAWKANFKAVHVTPRLVIKPPWEKYPKRRGEIVIEIDPGMAFGTGTHPTTQMCLKALEELIGSFSIPPSVLDVGTGSGILAIAARELGARKVLALDIDPVAIASARENAEKNNLAGVVDIRLGSLRGVRRLFDIVVANLLPQEILSLASSLAKRISPGGRLIVSGLLRAQKKEIASAFNKYGLQVLNSRESKGWACLLLRPENDGRNGEK